MYLNCCQNPECLVQFGKNRPFLLNRNCVCTFKQDEHQVAYELLVLWDPNELMRDHPPDLRWRRTVHVFQRPSVMFCITFSDEVLQAFL